jgi:hypothetical protein
MRACAAAPLHPHDQLVRPLDGRTWRQKHDALLAAGLKANRNGRRAVLEEVGLLNRPGLRHLQTDAVDWGTRVEGLE